MNHELSPEEILRYSRQLIIPEIGIKGQIKLKESSILIVGCGGLGTPLALYLSAAGIGRIGIVDHDTLDISNLHRQVIYSTEDIGKPKVESARKRMLAINPEIQVDAYNELFTSKNARTIAEPYQIIIDGTDNLPTRYLINDLCVFTNKLYIYGAVYRFFGQVSVFDSSVGPCYRCVFPVPPPPDSIPPCAVAGVVGVLPGIIGQIQAAEAIKFILGIGTPLVNQLLLYDALENTTTKIKISKNPDCIVCGERSEIFDLIDYEKFCKTTMRGDDLIDGNVQRITPGELSKRMRNEEDLRIIDLREPIELEISVIQRSVNIPFIKLTEEMRNWKKSQPIVLVCQIGFLSAVAQRMLAAEGLKMLKACKGECVPGK